MDTVVGEAVEHIVEEAAGRMSVHTAEVAVGCTAGIEAGRIENAVGGNIAAAADCAVETAADSMVRLAAGCTGEVVGGHIVVLVAVGTAVDTDCTHVLEEVVGRRSIETP